eukprot:g19281.t1
MLQPTRERHERAAIELWKKCETLRLADTSTAWIMESAVWLRVIKRLAFVDDVLQGLGIGLNRSFRGPL